MRNNFKKPYPPVPPGKRLIFRWSRARRRPYPLIVDDVPVQRVRPVKMHTAKPVRRRQPVQALTIQPPRLAQFPRTAAVTVVPAPITPRMPHPGTHGDAHDVIGAFAGGARALHQTPAGQSAGSNLLEMLGGALAGASATRLSAAIGQAMPKEHANITEGLAEKGEAHGAELAQHLRKLADEIDECAAVEAGPNGNGLLRVGLLLLEGLMRITAGAVTGAPAGARAHLTLVKPTEENVQRLVSNI